MLHTHILTNEQKTLLPLLKFFRRNYYLVGGTAIALQIGHRRSIDFDLFTSQKINRLSIKKILSAHTKFSKQYSYEDSEQIHLNINSVKFTFFNFPFSVPASIDFNKIIKMPTLLDLAAMKAFAFGGRAKWKDYVDVFFLIKYHFTVAEISKRTEELFNLNSNIIFSKKLFVQQLAFYKDIDYSESVEYIGTPISEDEIKSFLTEVSLASF